jgi:hypothetical protein
MRAYTVHAPPDEAEPERFAFVKDGFSWPALFVPILWVLWHRLWLALVWYLAWLLTLAWVDRLAGEGFATALAIVGAVWLAAEGNDIRRRSLASRGWRELGAAGGKNLEEAEVRFFAEWNRPAQAAQPAQPPTIGAVQAARQQTIIRAAYPPSRAYDREETVLGLFPEAER